MYCVHMYCVQVYKMNRGSIGSFEYDAFISYASSPNMDGGDEEDPEEMFVKKLIDGLEGGGGGGEGNDIRYVCRFQIQKQGVSIRQKT